MDDLHRKLLNRLAAAWLTISLVLGGGLLIYGIETIDDQLVDIAIKESRRLTSTSLPLINRPQNERGALESLVADFVQGHFIVAELYNQDRQLIVEAVNPQHVRIEDELKRRGHELPRDEQPHYEKFFFDGHAVMRVVVPLRIAEGPVTGYFEGVFLIDPNTVAALRREVALTLAIVLGAVLLTSLAIYPVILALNRDVLRYSRDLLHANIELMEVMGSAIAKRDSDTNIHNYRVSIYAVRLGEAAGLDQESIRDLIAGAFLHDVGKIGISDTILLKPASLDESEFLVMKTHVALGVDIIKKSAWLQRARNVVEFHHEKFDGNGYLRGLKGEDIPLTARIFAIVDVFDALTSRRPYKSPMPFREVMAIIKGSAGTHFDPVLVKTFDGMIEPLFRQISEAADAEVEQRLRDLIAGYFLPTENR